MNTSDQQGMTRRQFISKASFLGLAGAAALASSSLSLTALSGCKTGPSTKAQDFERALANGDAGYFEFTDSVGRKVALPTNVARVAPSGPIAQLILATLCPEKMVSLASNFAHSQADYLGEELNELPVLGRFYGASADLNYEEMINMDPDVIVDIGETKLAIAEDMDSLQKSTGIPCIYVEATLVKMDQAYQTLGEALDSREAAAPLIEYAQKTLSYAAERHDEIAAEGLKVLYAAGPYGTQVKDKGSIHAGCLELLGVNNVAVLEETNSTEVNLEQVMLWAPEVVLLSYSDGFFDEIYDDAVWREIPAVQKKQVYEVPGKPYEWLDKPPSVQTLLGLLWLGNLLYPERYDFDIVAEAQEFYKLFWHYDLSEQEAKELMARSSFLGQEQ